MRSCSFVINAILLVAVMPRGVWAEEAARVTGAPRPNIPSPTLGGKQFWADELLFYQWRIQRNALTDHYRLLDEDNVRRAWGTFEECHTVLETMKQRENLPPMKGKVVILLHGLGRTRAAMSGMASYLEKTGDYTVLRFSYPSGMAEIEEHAKSFDRVLSHLEGVDEIYLVAHSLGNIVIRRYFHDRQHDKNTPDFDRRIRRVVMLAPPNHGSRLAQMICENELAGSLIGKPGHELAENWTELSKTLATPPCEFAVIAGGKSDDKGYNPLLPGDDDMVVTVAETRLQGARDFLLVPAIHTLIVDDKMVREATLSFLNSGYLVARDRCQPIE